MELINYDSRQPYEDFGNAIIVRACDDYVDALKELKKPKPTDSKKEKAWTIKQYNALQEIRNINRFIWKHVDRIGDLNLADEIEASLLDDYLMETKFIIPEEDWYEIQTRGYDIEMMRHDADEEHPEWRDEIENALDEAQDEEGFLTVFFRGFEIGTSGAEVEEMTWNW